MLVSHIHIDLVGPLPQSKVFSYILTCIDQFTHWADAIPLTNVTVQSAAEAFVSIWISRFGVPSTITTDRGSQQFESSLWKHLHAMELLGFSRIRTTSYHPMSNGLIERFHRHLKAAILAQPDPTDWTDCLSLVLLGIRTALKKDLGCTPTQLVYGSTLCLDCSKYRAFS